MEREQAIFMQSVIKQCSNFFLSLHKYCEEYAEKLHTSEKLGKKGGKKAALAAANQECRRVLSSKIEEEGEKGGRC